MKSLTVSDTLHLSVAERIQLAEDIWDSVVESNANLAVTKKQKDELDRRHKRYASDSQTATWDQLKKRIHRR
jgi:putative addiction module component (TIGR02574 family)